MAHARRYAVIGLGRVGKTLALALADAGAEVVAVDSHPELVDEVADRVALAACLDSTNEKALRAQGIDQVEVAIIAIGENFEANALTTAIVKGMGVPKVITRARDMTQQLILGRIGADDVIFPEYESAMRLARKLMKPNVIDHIQLADGHSLVQIRTPESFVGRSIRDLNLRQQYGVNVVAIRKGGASQGENGDRSEQVINNVRPDYVIESGDRLVVVGNDAELQLLSDLK